MANFSVGAFLSIIYPTAITLYIYVHVNNNILLGKLQYILTPKILNYIIYSHISHFYTDVSHYLIPFKTLEQIEN